MTVPEERCILRHRHPSSFPSWWVILCASVPAPAASLFSTGCENVPPCPPPVEGFMSMPPAQRLISCHREGLSNNNPGTFPSPFLNVQTGAPRLMSPSLPTGMIPDEPQVMPQFHDISREGICSHSPVLSRHSLTNIFFFSSSQQRFALKPKRPSLSGAMHC